jgi:hypothetical protein
MLLTKAYEAYVEAKTKSQLWREEHLDSLDEAQAKKNKSTPRKNSKPASISNNNKQARNVKHIRQKLDQGAIKKLYYTENNIRTECVTQITKKNACIRKKTMEAFLKPTTLHQWKILFSWPWIPC